MKKAAFHTLGCKVNAYETEVMKEQLASHGYEIVAFNEAADVYIVNTCTVTNMADQKSRQMLHRARKKNPDAVIAAVGCYAQAAKDSLLADQTADLIIGSNQKGRLYDLLEEFERNHMTMLAVDDLTHNKEYEPLFLSNTEDRTRAFLKIQDGCNQFCSYCLIPFARGRARSRAYTDVLREIEGLARKGFKEVVLTGIHLSSFGRDLNDEKLPLLKELIVEAGKIPGIKRIRLGSLEPNIITEDFLKAVSSCEAFCPHFHLSMQSGSDATLKRMNRHYTAEEYFEKCELIRNYFEHAAITTDVIAGFPGETEEEFLETLAFVKRVGFAEMHVFKYSRRKGTKADTMKNQVPDAVKTERSKRLMEVAEASQRDYLSWYVGKEVEILTEDQVNVDGKTRRDGHTKTYVKCVCDCDKANELVTAKVIAVSEEKTLITV